MGKKDILYATDCKCVTCREQAVEFFPLYDSKATKHAYCKACIMDLKIKLLQEMYDYKLP